MKLLTSSEDDFYANVTVDDKGCWLWTGKLNQGGYGIFARDGENTAYRWSYVHHKGPVPPGLHLDHLCKVKSCVCPDHLEPVTPRENVRRARGLSEADPKSSVSFAIKLEHDQDAMLRKYCELHGWISKASVVDEALFHFFAKHKWDYPRSGRAKKGTKAATITYNLDAEQLAALERYAKEFDVRPFIALADEALGEFFARRGRHYPRTYSRVTGRKPRSGHGDKAS